MSNVTYLCALSFIPLYKDSSLQVVVPAGSEGPLDIGAILDACLDPGQGQVLWEQHLTAADLILTHLTNTDPNRPNSETQQNMPNQYRTFFASKKNNSVKYSSGI